MTYMNEIKPGKYKHYKGGLYKVHGMVKHSETLEDMVLYETLYENDLGKMWVRPAKMFLENVETPEGNVPRFAIMESK